MRRIGLPIPLVGSDRRRAQEKCSWRGRRIGDDIDFPIGGGTSLYAVHRSTKKLLRFASTHGFIDVGGPCYTYAAGPASEDVWDPAQFK